MGAVCCNSAMLRANDSELPAARAILESYGLFSELQLQTLFKLFQKMDRDSSRSVDMREFYQEFGARESTFVNNLFSKIDKESGSNGSLAFTSFCDLLCQFTALTADEVTMFMFRWLDLERSGVLTSDNLKLLVGKLGAAASNTQSTPALRARKSGKQIVAEILAQFDVNGDGVIDIGEFKEICASFPSLLQSVFEFQETVVRRTGMPKGRGLGPKAAYLFQEAATGSKPQLSRIKSSKTMRHRTMGSGDWSHAQQHGSQGPRSTLRNRPSSGMSASHQAHSLPGTPHIHGQALGPLALPPLPSAQSVAIQPQAQAQPQPQQHTRNRSNSRASRIVQTIVQTTTTTTTTTIETDDLDDTIAPLSSPVLPGSVLSELVGANDGSHAASGPQSRRVSTTQTQITTTVVGPADHPESPRSGVAAGSGLAVSPGSEAAMVAAMGGTPIGSTGASRRSLSVSHVTKKVSLPRLQNDSLLHLHAAAGKDRDRLGISPPSSPASKDAAPTPTPTSSTQRSPMMAPAVVRPDSDVAKAPMRAFA